MTDISERPITAPEGFPICIRAYGDETESSRLGHLVGALVCHISRTFDLSGLDGMTIAGDYVQALAELDRGYAATIVLTPSIPCGTRAGPGSFHLAEPGLLVAQRATRVPGARCLPSPVRRRLMLGHRPERDSQFRLPWFHLGQGKTDFRRFSPGLDTRKV